eukprot:CAMPEP_0179252602 /NCGR_PEP_ID=MMETSP0797-20121207/22299_1 /TAXON_ID=47934 /ORGANISM="Dinophysis acuminata, Strain DAEP01" /LENGTH=75 /DNA_ID=CAMNT_0020960437 /DNA_START=60 /DNA_END=287 /DNA_ORIENTATION=-
MVDGGASPILPAKSGQRQEDGGNLAFVASRKRGSEAAWDELVCPEHAARMPCARARANSMPSAVAKSCGDAGSRQ